MLIDVTEGLDHSPESKIVETPNGYIVNDVVLLSEFSRNRGPSNKPRRYSKALQEGAVKSFDGLQINVNHPPLNRETGLVDANARSLLLTIGHVSNPRRVDLVREGKQISQIKGSLNLIKCDASEHVIKLMRLNPKIAGMSITGGGAFEESANFDEVVGLKPATVDVVHIPATTVGFFEGLQMTEELAAAIAEAVDMGKKKKEEPKEKKDGEADEKAEKNKDKKEHKDSKEEAAAERKVDKKEPDAKASDEEKEKHEEKESPEEEAKENEANGQDTESVTSEANQHTDKASYEETSAAHMRAAFAHMKAAGLHADKKDDGSLMRAKRHADKAREHEMYAQRLADQEAKMKVDVNSMKQISGASPNNNNNRGLNREGDETMPTLLEAFEAATNEQKCELMEKVQGELLKPIGYPTFAALKIGIDKMKASITESEQKLQLVSEAENQVVDPNNRKMTLETLKGAGMAIDKIEDVRIDAYLSLSESLRPEFVKTQQNGVVSSTPKVTTKEEVAKVIAESFSGGSVNTEKTENVKKGIGDLFSK